MRNQAILLIVTAMFVMIISGTAFAEDNITKNDIKINCTTIYSGSTHQELMADAAKEYPNMNYTTHLTTKLPTTLNFSNQNLIMLDLYSDSYVPVVQSAIDDAKKRNATVIVLSPQSDLAKNLSSINMTQHPYILEYFNNGGYENEKRLINYVMINFFGLNETVEAPVVYPTTGIYHPDSSVPFASVSEYLQWYQSDGTHYKYDPSKPTVAILFHRDTYVKETTPWVNSLIYKLEAQGINCVAEFGMSGDSLSVLMNTTSLTANLPMDLIISAKSFRLRSYSSEPIENGVVYLQALNIPIIRAVVGMYQISPEMWANSTDGIPSNLIGTRVAMPELDGVYESIVVAGQVKKPDSDVYITVPIEEQMNWLVSRVSSWINLRRKSNEEKKIAVIYYHHTPGRGEVGVMDEGGLNTHESLVNFLQALKDQGYDIGGSVPTVDELRAQMQLYGKNVGVWAPGELEIMVNTGKVELIPLDEYLQWFNALPQANREAVINMWGEPPGDIMVYEKDGQKYIVIPMVKFGNILLAPQPMRSKDQSTTAMFTDDAIPPTHQYIAFYMWMNKVYGADALIHFGTYGSFEYLPGKQTGLSATTDWPAILIQDMPHIYLYTIDGTAGATQAKRRANALIIDYSTPAIIASGLYGDLTTLETDLTLYDQAVDETVKTKQRDTIINTCKTLNLDKDLNVDLNAVSSADAFDVFKITLRDYLTRLKSEYMPYGLHVLGESITGDHLVSMVNSMLGLDFINYTTTNSISENQTIQLINEVVINGKTPEDAQNLVLGKTDSKLTDFLNTAKLHAQNLQSCDQEMTSLLNALEGQYVAPGPGGDPIRKPDALPSGRDLYSFDPREIPIKSSRDLGVTMANDLINKYLNETGEYPKKVSVFLWATETMKHLGVMEAEILALLGVKVEYDSYNRPTKLSLIPSEELGRPRIDVLIVPSGIYRDTFPIQMALLDKAIRMAAEANDTAYPNYVKENSEALYEWLQSQGYDNATAKELSMTRLFSAAPGGYGPSISVPIAHTDKWDDEGDIADLFIRGWGYAYSQTQWGVDLQSIFNQNLKGVDVVTHSISSNNYGMLYGDGYFSDLGGLILAVRTASGKEPMVYLNNLRNPTGAKVESFDQFLSMELRSRNLNPTWIQGMMEQGYYGAAMMSAGVENLWGWTVTDPSSVSQSMWNDVIDTYVYDKNNIGVSQWLSTDNRVYSMISIYGTLLKATQKGYIQMDQQTLTDVANRWANLIAQYGTSCCDCSCANIAMVEWATQYVNPDMLAQFNSQMYKSTQYAGFAPSPTSYNPDPSSAAQPQSASQSQSASATTQSSSQSSGVAGESGEQSQSEESASPGEQGEAKAYEVTKEGNSGTSDSGLPA
ncbi:MAG: cobaltochelatase subunit CobN, partial [Methanobacterium sp.]|nr:cobaltochelatase subunit CobN [Methanobacterium sp.]